MRHYAVLDTNVLVSALLNPKSIPGEVLRQALLGDIIPLYDERIIQEYNEVLHREKFHFDHARVRGLLEEYVRCGRYIEAAPVEDEMFLDTDDIAFYEVAFEEQKEDAWLVTGNLKHYPIKSFVVTPRQMLDILKK